MVTSRAIIYQGETIYYMFSQYVSSETTCIRESGSKSSVFANRRVNKAFITVIIL
jgi:hypothetical protein